MRFIVLAFSVAVLAAGATAQVALTPSAPVPSTSPVFVSGSPALTVPNNQNLVTTNASLIALSDSLISLQTNLQQTLMALTVFNNNFDFVSLGDNGAAATTAQNPRGNFAVNLATNFAVNAGVNSAVSTGGSLFNTVANRPATPAAAGLPQGFASIPITRDSLRTLLVLQSKIQEILPVVNAVNNGNISFPGSFTNLFGLTPTGQ